MGKFLVTGGAGFIGSNIAEKLIKEGHFVRVLDNFHSGKESNLQLTQGLGKDKFELIKGDIRNKEDCQKACSGMEYVLHQAALRSVPKSMIDPQSFHDVNINGILCILQAASKQKIKRFVYASSSSVYGNADKFPQKEGHVPMPISPYALTKLAGEYYCRIFSENFGLETACLRYFNIFGPNQPLDDEYSAVIPKFINYLFRDEAPPIFGNGKQARNFTFVENVVYANILAATTPGIKHEIFNVAAGKDNSILKLVAVLNEIMGKNISPKFLPLRAGDIFRTQADISKARRILKYKPLVNFEDGLKKTVEYFKNKPS